VRLLSRCVSGMKASAVPRSRGVGPTIQGRYP
jgi:hypothetical protein